MLDLDTAHACFESLHHTLGKLAIIRKTLFANKAPLITSRGSATKKASTCIDRW
jgi:hypothetical protein